MSKPITTLQAVTRFTRALLAAGMKRHSDYKADELFRIFAGHGIYVRIVAGNDRPVRVDVADRKGFDRWANSVNFWVEGIPADAKDFLKKVTALRKSGVWSFNFIYPAVQLPVQAYQLSDDIITQYSQVRPEGVVLERIPGSNLPVGFSGDLREAYCKVVPGQKSAYKTWVFRVVRRKKRERARNVIPHGVYNLKLVACYAYPQEVKYTRNGKPIPTRRLV